MVAIDESLPPSAWRLSDEGERAANALRGDALLAPVALIFASPEPKALATAYALASDRPVEIVGDLREVERPAGWIANGDEWERAVAECFARPDEPVRGCEPAAAARRRFVAAVDALLARHPAETIALVSHGTVLTLYLAELLGRAPRAEDVKRIGLPDRALVDPVARLLLVDWRTAA